MIPQHVASFAAGVTVGLLTMYLTTRSTTQFAARTFDAPQQEQSKMLVDMCRTCVSQKNIPSLEEMLASYVSAPRAFPTSLSAYNGTAAMQSATNPNVSFEGNATIRMKAACTGVCGEMVMTQAPACLVPSEAADTILVPSRQSVTCRTFESDSPTRAEVKCADVHAFFEDSRDASANKPTFQHVQEWPSDMAMYLPKSTFVILIARRDTNVCHAAMRLMYAWNILRRTMENASVVPEARYSNSIVLLAGSLYTYFSDRNKYHGGLVHELFDKWGFNIVVAKELRDVAQGYGGPVCMHSLVFIGSHSNRFGFQEKELTAGIHSDYGSALSTDALALRRAVFYPKDPPRMGKKLVYISRRVGGRRSFEQRGEKMLRVALANICKELRLDFVIMEDRERPLSFRGQTAYVADARFIVGMHGAGLTHGITAPPGCVLIEIKPECCRLVLFESLRDFGLKHRVVLLSNGTEVKGTTTNRVIAEDVGKLINIIREESVNSSVASNLAPTYC